MNKPELYVKFTFNVTVAEKNFGNYWHHIKWEGIPQSIIDVGIGDGRVAKLVIIPRLPGNIKEYIGSDASHEMLTFSEKIIDFSKFQTNQMDICAGDIPIEYQNRFDKVFASFVLHILGSKTEQGVRNLYKLLKPGGQLIYTTLERMPNDEVYEKLDKTKWCKYHNSKFKSAFSTSKNPMEEYGELMKATGFEENFMTSEDEFLRFSDLQTARGVWESVNLNLKEIPSEEYHEYIEEYLKLMQQEHSIEESTGEVVWNCKVMFSVVTKPMCSHS